LRKRNRSALLRRFVAVVAQTYEVFYIKRVIRVFFERLDMVNFRRRPYRVISYAVLTLVMVAL
jgi:hypothetical protein